MNGTIFWFVFQVHVLLVYQFYQYFFYNNISTLILQILIHMEVAGSFKGLILYSHQPCKLRC